MSRVSFPPPSKTQCKEYNEFNIYKRLFVVGVFVFCFFVLFVCLSFFSEGGFLLTMSGVHMMARVGDFHIFTGLVFKTTYKIHMNILELSQSYTL